MEVSYVDNPQPSPEVEICETGLREDAIQPPIYSSNVADENSSGVDMWETSGSLQPAELLNTNAKAGKFSLQNVLSTENPSDPDEIETKQSESMSMNVDKVKNQSMDDPIISQILNFPVALGLFDR